MTRRIYGGHCMAPPAGKCAADTTRAMQGTTALQYTAMQRPATHCTALLSFARQHNAHAWHVFPQQLLVLLCAEAATRQLLKPTIQLLNGLL
jgi:hypothetical protein